MRAVSFLGEAFAIGAVAGVAGAAGAGGGVIPEGETAGLGGCVRATVGFGPIPGGFGGMPTGAIGFTGGRPPGVESGLGANGGTEEGLGNAGGGATGAGGVIPEGGLIGAVATRVVSFFGAAAMGEMRIVCPFKIFSLFSGAGELPSSDGVLRRTVSRFTTGTSLGFEGRVMRTVSFFGIAGGVSEGASSAIIIRLFDFYLIARI